MEDAIEILNGQFAACELVKLDAAGLRAKEIGESEKQSFVGSIVELGQNETSTSN